MSSKAKKSKRKNKEAIEFVLANRESDDPNYNNPTAPNKILLHVQKEDTLNPHQAKILKQIPEICRGVYTEEDHLKKIGLLDANAPKKELIEELEDIHMKKVKFDFTKNEVLKYEKGKKMQEASEEPVEEIVDTTKKHNELAVESHQGNLNNEDKQIVAENKKDPTNIDDKELEELFQKVTVKANIVEYNEFGLKKDVDPEVLQYVTNKEFREGIDIFIPAPVINEKEFNKIDIDIKPEEMNDDYKEVYEAMNSNDENSPKEELEDNFILLANEGQLPIEFNTEIKVNDKQATQSDAKNDKKIPQPSYKYITQEEKEFLDKQFLNIYSKEYSESSKGNQREGKFAPKEVLNSAVNEILNKKKKKGKNKLMGLTSKYEDEEEFEEYEEEDEEEDFAQEENEDEWEECEEEDEAENKEDKNQKHDAKSEEKDENKIEYCQNHFPIEYMTKDKEKEKEKSHIKHDKIKPKSKKKIHKNTNEKEEEEEDIPLNEEEEEEFTIENLNDLIHDKKFIQKTLELFDNKKEEEFNDDDLNKLLSAPKKRKDISTAQGKILNLPKKVGETNEIEKERKKQKGFKMRNTENKKDVVEREEDIPPPKSKNISEETKEDKKHRKKLVKLDKREKRKANKQLKNAFKDEKLQQMKQIAKSNQVIRHGLAVKEL